VNYLYDVSPTWSSDDSSTGSVSPLNGIQTTFTAQEISTDATCTVTATYGIHTDSTGLLTVLAPTIDYITIEDASGGTGNVVDTATYSVLDTDDFYAIAYNNTVDYLYDVNADWESDDPSIGSITTPGTMTTLTAEWIDSDQTCTITATYNGHEDTTGLQTILSPRIDFIKVEDTSGGFGSEVDTMTFCVAETYFFHAAAYNNTVLYLYDVEADWECSVQSVGSVDPLGKNSMFTALQVSKTATCVVNATYQSLKDSTGLITVLAPTVNYIKIRNEAGGAGVEITTVAYGIEDTDQFYAAAYNDTVGYLFEIPAQWSTDAKEVGDVSPPSGGMTTFTAQDVLEDGTCTITATYSVFSDSTGLITVLFSTLDEIRIMDAPGGSGNVITSATYFAGATQNLYAAGFNDTTGYLGDFEVTWISNNEDVGAVDATGIFTAQIVLGDNVCTVTATLEGISGSTGLLLVLAPTIDEIRICDEAGGAGDEITTATFEAGETDTFHAAAYNDTAEYLYDVTVTWTIDSESAGEVTPQGTSTTFTAGISRELGTCTITATYQDISGSTGLLTINALVDVTPPVTPGKPILETEEEDRIEISWTPNTEEDLDRYVVQRAENPDGPFNNVATLDPDETTYVDKRLDPGTKYYYRVIAYDDTGNPSEPSQVIEAQTEEPVSFFEEFLWLFIIMIIIVVVIIAAAMASRRRKSKPPEQTPQTQPAPQKTTTRPPPPKRASRPQAKKVVPKVPVTTKPKTPPPKTEKTETPPPPPPPEDVQKEEMPPPPPPED
jgi:hypothetical protein